MRDIKSVLANINKAIEREPNNPKWAIKKLQFYLTLKETHTANSIADLLLKIDALPVDLCAEFALALNTLKRYESALHYYQIAFDSTGNDSVQDRQHRSQILFNMAAVHRYLGHISTAKTHLDKAIELNPNDAEAHLLRSSLTKQTLDSNHIEQLSELFAHSAQNQTKNRPPLHRTQLGYALAKELEDLQRYEQCFDVLCESANVRRQNMQYQVKQDVQTIAKIMSTFDENFVQRTKGQGCNSDEPIFILGLPRTGSTLIERIVSQHSHVFAAGELNDFALAMMAQVKADIPEQPKDKLALIESTASLNFQALGQRYIQSTRPETGHTPRFIDKLPLNSLYVGLIKAALPNAKIIRVKRHPLDTCFAIFKQLFTNGYPFSYDLNELADYYIAHHQLMDHWQRLYPDDLYQIEYENVVVDLSSNAKNLSDKDINTEAKRLIEYCNLPWESACVEFDRNQQPSTTASAAQVRQKVYSSSVGKWRCFETQLAPLKNKLEKAGIICD